jgi:hypothetical protein
MWMLADRLAQAMGPGCAHLRNLALGRRFRRDFENSDPEVKKIVAQLGKNAKFRRF